MTAVENFKGIAPTAVGYYKRAQLGAGKGGVGFAMRRRELADIGVAVHEAVHYYDDLLGLTDLNRPLSESAARNLNAGEQVALLNESYQDPGSRTVKEGLAEAIRLMVMVENPIQAFRSLTAYDAANKIINSAGNEQLVDFIKASRKDVEQYMAQPDALKVQQAMTAQRAPLISPSESYFARNARGRFEIPALLRSLERRFLYRIRDLHHAERATEQRFKEFWTSHNPKSTVTSDQAWAEVVRRGGGKPTQMILQHSNLVSAMADNALFGDGIMSADRKKTYGQNGAKTFEDFSQAEIEEFGRYMYASVSLQRMDKDPSYQAGEVDGSTLQAYVAKTRNSKFDTAAKEVTEYFNGLLKMMEDNGLITDIDYKNMVASHQLYMPFYRQFADENYGTSGGKFIGVQAPIQKLGHGSVMPVLDVYDAMVGRTHEVIGAVNRRRVEDAFIDVFEGSGVADEFLRVTNGPGPDTISRTKNGQTVHYQIDKDLKQVLSTLGTPKMANIFAKTMSKFTNMGRNLMVQWNPAFAARNFPRDAKTAQIKGLQDTTGFDDTSTKEMLIGPVKDLVKSLTRQDLSDVDKLYDERGGRLETRAKTAGQQVGGRLTQRRRKGFGKQEEGIIDHMAKVLKAATSLNEATELAPRRVAFLSTLHQLSKVSSGWNVDPNGKIDGEVPEWAIVQAMSNAQEITVNFNRRGEWSPYIEPYVLFFNAAMQGSFYSRGQVFGSPAALKRLGMWTALAATAHIASLGAMAMMRSPDDEDETMLDKYWEIPKYYKENQSVVALNLMGHSVAIGIPREREWGPIQRVIEEVAESIFSETGARTFDEARGTAWHETKSVIKESIPFTGGPISTAAQLYVNKNLHWGEAIESEWDQRKEISERYDSRTMGVAKFMSQSMLSNPIFFEGLSPKEVDFALRSVGVGSLASYGDMVTRPGDKLPFMVDEKPRQSVNDFYVKQTEITQRASGIAAGTKDKDEAQILESQAAFAAAGSIMKKIRKLDIDDGVKQKYITGVARWALGRKADALYPNPLVDQSELPPKVASEIRKMVRNKSN